MPNDTNVNTGNAGEYFVAGELERRGFTVAVPMSNVKDFDILAINRETYEQFAIQVKTTGYKQKRWTLSQKNEKLVGDNIFYVFVSLNELSTPEYHIVPSEVVANTITKDHEEWLRTPGKKGQKHNNTSIRKFSDNEDEYLDRWELLSSRVKRDIAVERGGHESLTKYISKLKNIEYAKIYPETQTGDGSIERPYQMPFYVYADVVIEFVDEVYRFERQHPECGLEKYRDILKNNNIEWSDTSMKSVDLKQHGAKVIMALLLATIRADRFCEGALKDFLECGYIEKLLLRLKEIDEEKG